MRWWSIKVHSGVPAENVCDCGQNEAVALLLHPITQMSGILIHRFWPNKSDASHNFLGARGEANFGVVDSSSTTVRVSRNLSSMDVKHNIFRLDALKPTLVHSFQTETRTQPRVQDTTEQQAPTHPGTTPFHASFSPPVEYEYHTSTFTPRRRLVHHRHGTNRQLTCSYTEPPRLWLEHPNCVTRMSLL